MARPQWLQRIIDYLRAGYPDGVPEHDYIPLLALLGRHLSEPEVSMVVNELSQELASSGQGSTSSIRQAVLAVSGSPATESDIARVRAHLEKAGWDLSNSKQGPADKAGHDKGAT